MRSPDGEATGEVSYERVPCAPAIRNTGPNSRGSPRSPMAGLVVLAKPRAEAGVELLDVEVEGPLEGLLDLAAERVAELVDEVAQPVVAPLRLDELEDHVAEPVGEVAVDAVARPRGRGRRAPRRA